MLRLIGASDADYSDSVGCCFSSTEFHLVSYYSPFKVKCRCVGCKVLNGSEWWCFCGSHYSEHLFTVEFNWTTAGADCVWRGARTSARPRRSSQSEVTVGKLMLWSSACSCSQCSHLVWLVASEVLWSIQPGERKKGDPVFGLFY